MSGTSAEFGGLIDWLGHDMLSVDLTTRRIRWVSPSAAARLGAPIEMLERVELRGETLTAMLSRLFVDEPIRARMATLLDGDLGDSPSFEYRVRERGGERWRRATARIVDTEHGKQLDLVSIDITELIESQRATERAEILRRLSQAIHEAGDLETAITLVCDEVQLLLKVSRSTILLFDDTGTVSVVRTWGPVAEPPPSSTRSALEAMHAVHGRVAQFPELHLHPELPGWEYLTRIGVKSLATAAIGAGQIPLGLLNVSMVGETRTFTAHEMRLLGDVATLIAAPLAHVALEDERRRAVKQVQAADERARAALDATGTAIWELDPVTGQVSWDARCYELWDVDPARGPDRDQARERMHPDDRPLLSEAYARALDPDGSGDFAIQYRYFGPGGVLRWLGAKGRCFFGPDRQPRRFIGTITDTTAQHRAEDERIATERRYRDMIETMSEGVGVLDASGRLSFANRSCAEIFGYPSEDTLVGLDLQALLFPEDRASEVERFQKDMHAPTAESRRVRRFQSLTGQEVWASVATVPLRDGDRVTGLLCVVTDVTASRRLESKLMQAQKLESLGVLAGGIAHDFNNLLVGVLGNAGLARSDLPPESPALDAITSIETAAVRASELTRQLLAYAGKGRFVIGRIDLRKLVEEMGHLLSAVIGKGVLLRYQFGSDIPPIEGDATQLRQVVMNLITNASDAIGERSGIVTIATSLIDVDRAYLAELLLEDELSPGYFVCLQVSDTGLGMTHETRERIFEPFFSTKFTGRGLGLAAVLGILRAHRGAIKVYSEVGRGTTFKVLLPASDVVADVEAPPSVDPGAGGGTILVVDDEETVRSVMKRILVKGGFRVLTAQDGVDGLAMFSAHQQEIRAVILDVTMPRMGGEEAFRRLRQIDPNVRVLLASGYSEQEATSQFVGKGLAGFLEKPFRPQSLLDKVRAMLA